MFIGHYGPAFAAKAAVRRIPLWVLFVAVQWMDVCWAALVLLGVEKMRVIPGFTEASALDLYYMPFTHGLAGALALSVLFGGVVALFIRKQRGAVFLISAAAVFSHWLLDFLVHVPDLPLWGDTLKVGLGLWRHEWISLPLEIAFVVAGALAYARYVPAKPRGNLWLWLFVAAMLGTEAYGAFGPLPADAAAQARTALLGYGVLALLAGLVDLTRQKPA